MRTSTLIGAGAGVAILAGVWFLWGRKAMQVARGDAASARMAAKAIASNSTAAVLRRRDLVATAAGGKAIPFRKGATIETGFQGAYDAALALRGEMS